MTMLPKLPAIGLALALPLLALALPQQAEAQERMATVAVDIIRATKTPGKTDPRLEKFRVQLSDFSFKRYRLLDTNLITVGEKKTVSVSLEPDEGERGKWARQRLEGKDLKVTFVGVEKDGRAKLQLAIPGIVDTTVSLALDGSVILGGPAIPSGKNGVLFLPVTLVNVSD